MDEVTPTSLGTGQEPAPPSFAAALAGSTTSLAADTTPGAAAAPPTLKLAKSVTFVIPLSRDEVRNKNAKEQIAFALCDAISAKIPTTHQRFYAFNRVSVETNNSRRLSAVLVTGTKECEPYFQELRVQGLTFRGKTLSVWGTSKISEYPKRASLKVNGVPVGLTTEYLVYHAGLPEGVTPAGHLREMPKKWAELARRCLSKRPRPQRGCAKKPNKLECGKPPNTDKMGGRGQRVLHVLGTQPAQVHLVRGAGQKRSRAPGGLVS